MTNAPCRVLKCHNEAQGSWALGDGLRRREFGVCKAHGEALVGGADRRLDLEQRYIIMGGELAGVDEWVATSWHLADTDGSPNVQVILITRRLGATETREVRFSLTPKMRGELAQWLGRDQTFAPGGAGTYEPWT